MSPPPKQDFHDDRDDAFGDPTRRLRDTIAPGTTGNPNDAMNDFPLIRDAGEKPRANRAGVHLVRADAREVASIKRQRASAAAGEGHQGKPMA